MTVAELIEELKKQPQDARVFTHPGDREEAEVETIGRAVWVRLT